MTFPRPTRQEPAKSGFRSLDSTASASFPLLSPVILHLGDTRKDDTKSVDGEGMGSQPGRQKQRTLAAAEAGFLNT